MRKTIIIILSIFVLLGGVMYAHHKYYNQGKEQNNMQTITADEVIKNKMIQNNPAGLIINVNSKQELSQVIDVLVTDNAKLDPYTLYLTAIDAYSSGKLKEAGFFFFAASLRKSFDYLRYGIEPYSKGWMESSAHEKLSYLEMFENDGSVIIPTLTQDPQMFSEVADMIKKWQIIPVDDSLYKNSGFGEYVLPREDWPATAEKIKKSFLDNYVRTMMSVLNDPNNIEALKFIQDYKSGDIPRSESNDQKYLKFVEQINKASGG